MTEADEASWKSYRNNTESKKIPSSDLKALNAAIRVKDDDTAGAFVDVSQVGCCCMTCSSF